MDAIAKAQLTTEEFMVPALDPGIDIYVRNKRPADMTAFRPARTVLFVHGATYPAHTAFDLKLDGMSWMEYIAARGYDVYLLDLRGYGKSTRPPEMAQKPDANAPIVRTVDAVKDISAVVDFILERRDLPRLVLLGWSWGTFSTPTYAIANPSKVARLVLYAPIWIGMTGRLAVAEAGQRLPAYRTVTREQARALVQRRRRRAQGHAHSRRLFRRLGGRDLRHRSRRRQDEPAGDPRTQRRHGRLRRILVGRQALLRSGEDHGAGAPRHRGLG
jgi:pimeloyl-ACP methyl ester carboxylesterase